MKKHILVTLIFLSFIFTSCLKDKVQPIGDCETIISYTADIRPVIESSCKTGMGIGTGCHDGWIDDYSQIQAQLLSGNWQNEVFNEETMPLFPNDFGIDSLTADEISMMKCWIEQGYQEN